MLAILKCIFRGHVEASIDEVRGRYMWNIYRMFHCYRCGEFLREEKIG